MCEVLGYSTAAVASSRTCAPVHTYSNNLSKPRALLSLDVVGVNRKPVTAAAEVHGPGSKQNKANKLLYRSLRVPAQLFGFFRRT